MSVVTDILASWRGAAPVVRRHMARGRSEPFAFTFLVVFVLLALVAAWPEVARVAALEPGTPVMPQMLARALSLLSTVPFWYLLAAISHLAARAMGGQGSYWGARVALFWALAAVTPALLLMGLVAGMIGPGVQLRLLGWLTFAGFLWLWLPALREAERGDHAA